MTLTEAGELFYEEARDLLARADQAILRVRGRSRRFFASGTVRRSPPA